MTNAYDLVQNIKLLQEMQAIKDTLPVSEGITDVAQQAVNKAINGAKAVGAGVKNFGNNLAKEANPNNPNGFVGSTMNSASAKLEAIIKKIIAWVKTAWTKLSAIIFNDTKFIQQYEKELRSKASMVDDVPIKLPNIKPFEEILEGHGTDFTAIMNHDKQWIDAKINELNQANANLKIMRDTTIGKVGGIIKIMETMKKHAEYGKNAADQLTKMADVTAMNTDETDDAKTMAYGKLVRNVAMYRINMAAARHKAYKAALIAAIGKIKNVQEAAIEGAVTATESVINRYMDTITAMFNEGFEEPGRLLTYDKVDSYQQDPDKPADGTKGDVVGQCTTTLNVQESDLGNITNLADVIDESKLAKYVAQTVLEAREILRHGR